MGDIGRGGGRFMRPLGDEVPAEHRDEVEQELEHEHQVEEVTKAHRAPKRRWFSLRRRKPSS